MKIPSMAENKKQHFVPKHILKKFAADERQKQINLVHLPSGKTVHQASLRDQCYKDYFYGTDLSIEKNLSILEGHQAQLLNSIISSKNIHSYSLDEVPLFIVMQLARTHRAAADQDERFEKIVKLLLQGEIEDDSLRKVRISATNGVNLAMATALQVSPMLHDLKQVLIENTSNTPFVISDHPVILTNWFCRINFPNNAGTGFSNAGLQIFMPIEPHFAVLFLDAGVYQIADRSNTASITNDKDIQGLNALQYLNADKTLFFPPEYSDENLNDLMLTKGRQNQRFSFLRAENNANDGVYTPTDKDEYVAPSEGTKSEIVMISGIPLAKDIRFHGLGMKIRKTFHNDGTLASPLRDPVWVEIIENFSQSIFRGEISYTDLPSFLEKHPLEPHIGPIMKAELRRRRRKGR